MGTAQHADTSYAPDQRLGHNLIADPFILRIDYHVDSETGQNKHAEVE